MPENRDPYLDIVSAEATARKKIAAIRKSVVDRVHSARLLLSRGVDDAKQIKIETDLWLKFRELSKGVDKISIDLIDKLGVPYDCLFILGKKGIGKTWMMKEIFRKADEAGDWVIVGRNRLNEAKAHWVQSFNRSEDWYFTAQAGSDPMTLYSRKFRDLKTGKGEFRGYIATLKQCDTFFGQDYPKVKHIIFDEVVAHRENIVLAKDMDRFIKFLNSVVRAKKGVKAYFLGNLLRAADGSVEQEFMKRFNISFNDNLKYLTIKTEYKSHEHLPPEPIRMLYINTRDLFKGIGDEGGVAALSTNYTHADELESNTIDPTCPLVLDFTTHALYNIFFSIVVNYKNAIVAVVIREYNRTQEIVRGGLLTEHVKKHYACSVVGFQPHVHNVNCFTNLTTVARSFPESTKYRSDDELIPIWERILRIMKDDNFMFGNEAGYNELDNIMKKYYKNDDVTVENLY